MSPLLAGLGLAVVLAAHVGPRLLAATDFVVGFGALLAHRALEGQAGEGAARR